MADTVVFGAFTLALQAGRLCREGVDVPLPPRAYAVLAHLAERAGTLVSKHELLDAVWGHRHVSDSVLKVTVNTLRAALGEDARVPRYLHTVPRRGYRFELGSSAVSLREAQPAANAVSTDRCSGTGGNLSANLPSLIGREAEVAQLQAMLRTHRLVTLTGPSGVGKTSLALVCAAHEVPADGVWLVRLDNLPRPQEMVATVARALQLSAAAEQGLQPLARAMGPFQLRLVLDNAEHLLHAVAQLVQTLLEAAPGVQLLVTSQHALDLPDEQRLPVAPLGLPQSEAAAQSAPAAQLLLARVRQHLPSFGLGGRDAQAVVAICHALDGLPLALELAAARVPLLGLHGVQQRLSEVLDIAGTRPRQASQRHQTLRTALQWTFSLLAADELDLLQRLSVFEGGFRPEAAVAVAQAADASRTEFLLQSLLDHSLLVAQGQGSGGPRLSMLRSVRALAAEQLAARGLAEAVADAHLAHQLAWFGQMDERFLEMTTQQWVNLLRPEVDNLRAALRHAFNREQHQLRAAELFAVSAHFRVRAGWRHETLAEHRRLLAVEDADWPEPLRLRLRLAQALLGTYGQILPAQESLDRALGARDELQAAGERKLAALAAAACCVAMVRVQTPLAQRESALAVASALIDPSWHSLARRLIEWQETLLVRDQGRLEEYEARCQELMATCRARGDLSGAWVAAHGLALVLFATDRTAVARVVLQRVVNEMREHGMLLEFGAVLALLAVASVSEDAHAQTLALMREASRNLAADGMLWWMADALAWVPAHQGRWRDALRVQAFADALVASRGEKRGMMFARLRERFEQWQQRECAAASFGQQAAALPPLNEADALALALG